MPTVFTAQEKDQVSIIFKPYCIYMFSEGMKYIYFLHMQKRIFIKQVTDDGIKATCHCFFFFNIIQEECKISSTQ